MMNRKGSEGVGLGLFQGKMKEFGWRTGVKSQKPSPRMVGLLVEFRTLDLRNTNQECDVRWLKDAAV
jgi:hypothetical protein